MIVLNLKVCNLTLLVQHLRHLVRVIMMDLVLLDLLLVLQRQSPSYLVRRKHCLDLKVMLQSLRLATEIGSGSLFSYVSFTEAAAFVPAKADPLFAIDGGLRISAVEEQESELKFTAAWEAGGTLWLYWFWRGNCKRARWFWFYLCSRFWCQNRTRILHPLDSCWSRIYLLVCLLHRVCNICTCEEEGTLWILWCCYGHSVQLCMGDSRDYPSAAQRITQDLRSAQAYWFWFYLCSRFWCQNRTRILYSIHSRRIWKTWWIWWCSRSSWCKPTRRLYSLHSYGSGRYSSAHLLRAEVCSGKIPSRRGIHYLPTQSYRDWSATCRSSWRTGRVLYSCSRSWNWKTLWIQWCSRSSSLQSNRQDYPLLLRGQCYRERDQFHGRVWISFGFASATEATAVAEEKQALFSFAGNLQERTSCSTCYNWWTLWILQHNRSEGLRLSRAHYTLQVPWNSRRECIYCRGRNCNSGLDVNGNLVERATLRTRVQVRSSDSPAPPKRELSFLADSETSSPLLATSKSETNVEIGSGTLSDLLVEQRAHPTPKSSSLSSPSVETQLVEMSSLLLRIWRLVRSELVSATTEYLETDPEVSRSSDSEPSQRVQRSDLLEQKQSPSLQHHISLKVSLILRRELRILSPDMLNIETHNLLEL